MGKTLTRETNGELTFQYFPGGVLGSEKEVIEQMQVGAVQLSRVSLGIVGPVVPDVNVFNGAGQLSGSAGRITATAGSARQIQLGLRLDW